MLHTTLRTFITEANVAQVLTLPQGVRRIVVRPEHPTTAQIRLAKDKASFSIPGQSTSLPADSGYTAPSPDTLWLQSSLAGVSVLTEIWHSTPSLDLGASTVHSVTYKPQAGYTATSTDLTGTWAYAPTAYSWQNEDSWSNPSHNVTASLGNDTATNPSIEVTSSLIWSDRYEPINGTIPSAATITKIQLRLLAQAIQQTSAASLLVQAARISLIKASSALAYDFVANVPTNFNPVWIENSSNPFWITYDNDHDPLWGTTWTPSSFASGTFGLLFACSMIKQFSGDTGSIQAAIQDAEINIQYTL